MIKTKPASSAKGAIRIHKIMARTGICSLREAERMIAEGRVTVNGEIVTTGACATLGKDKIVVDGKPITDSPPLTYLMLNKPKGYVVTRSDEKGRRTVMEFLPKELKHLYPVGRLDMMSEGLLILTNDGDFANTLLSPKHNIDRVYSVKVRNIPTAKTLLKMTKGITVDGEKLKAISAEIEKSVGSNAWLRLVLHEGRNRHIRRLCETLGHPVLKLKRMAVGPLTLSGLKTGELRHIPVEKINRIRKIAGKKGTRKK